MIKLVCFRPVVFVNQNFSDSETKILFEKPFNIKENSLFVPRIKPQEELIINSRDLIFNVQGDYFEVWLKKEFFYSEKGLEKFKNLIQEKSDLLFKNEWKLHSTLETTKELINTLNS